MHSSREVSKQKQLADLVSQKLIDQLCFLFDFSSYHYYSISQNMKTMIQQECITTLTSFQLSKTQLAILEEANLEKLADKIAGTMVKGSSFNIVNGDGFTTTGLAKIYFNVLSCNVKMLVNDAINPFNSKMAHKWYEDYNGKYYDTATYDKLKGDKKVRSKAILSVFGKQLLLLSTPEQAVNLCNEINKTDNQFILALRKPRGLNGLVNTEANTNSFVSYENQLFSLTCTTNLLVKLVEKSLIQIALPIEIFNNTMFFFTSKERNQLANALPLVNKEMAKEKQNEVNAFRKTYQRN
jgi:hypothetical protein